MSWKINVIYVYYYCLLWQTSLSTSLMYGFPLLWSLRFVWRGKYPGSPSSTVCPEGRRPQATSFPGQCQNRYTHTGHKAFEEMIKALVSSAFVNPPLFSLHSSKTQSLAASLEAEWCESLSIQTTKGWELTKPSVCFVQFLKFIWM